jgi:hypothetical protein
MAEQFKDGDYVRFKGGVTYTSAPPWKSWLCGRWNLRPGEVIRVHYVSGNRLYYKCTTGYDFIIDQHAELVDAPAPFPRLRAARVASAIGAVASASVFGYHHLTRERITHMQSAVADIVQGGLVRTAIEHSLSAGCYLALAWMGLLLLRGVGKDMGKLGDRRRRIADEEHRRRIEDNNRTNADTRERNRIFKEEMDQKRARKAEKKERKLRAMAELVGRLQPSRLEERSDGRGHQLRVAGQPTDRTKKIGIGDMVEFLGPVNNNAMFHDGSRLRDVRRGDRVTVVSINEHGVFTYIAGKDQWSAYVHDVELV